MAALLMGVERMVDLIGRCRIYEVRYLDNSPKQPGEQDEEQQLKGTLLKLYTLILGFLCKASHFYDRNSLRRVCDALLNQSGIEEFLRDIECWEQRVHRDANNCSAKRLDSRLATLCDNVDQNKIHKILTWLSDIKYERLHYAAKENRAEGSGGWLLGHEKYLKWRRSSTSMILWLHGVRMCFKFTPFCASKKNENEEIMNEQSCC